MHNRISVTFSLIPTSLSATGVFHTLDLEQGRIKEINTHILFDSYLWKHTTNFVSNNDAWILIRMKQHEYINYPFYVMNK